MSSKSVLVVVVCGALFAVSGVVDRASLSYDPGASKAVSPTAAAVAVPPSVADDPAHDGMFEAVGVMVNAPIRDGENGFDDLAFAGSFARTRVAVRMRFPEGGLFELDRKSCSVSRFVDDRGTDLLGEDDMFGPIEMMPEIADDGSWVVFIIASPVLPAAGASRLDVAGTVAVRAATEREVVESRDVAFAEGSVVELGDYSLEVKSSGPSEWSDDWTFTVKTRDDLSSVISWVAIDGDGNEHALQPTMSMRGMGTWEQTLSCDTPLDRVTLRVEAWADARRVEVPFEVSTGLGLR